MAQQELRKLETDKQHNEKRKLEGELREEFYTIQNELEVATAQVTRSLAKIDAQLRVVA